VRLLLYLALVAFVMAAEPSRADDRLLSSAWTTDSNGGQQKMKVHSTVHFEPNRGQVKGRTEWMAQARGAAVYITGPEVVFALGNDNAHMKFAGARVVKGMGLDPTGGYSNYFLGKTEESWFTGVPHYGSVRYANVYPGIDIVYHSQDGNVEYDFVLAPGADPNQIELAFDRDVQIGEDGDLVLAGLRQHRPRVMQNGHEIASEYQLMGRARVRIRLAHYGRTRPLTIDPVLDFSTYLGGPGDDVLTGITLDAAGNIFLYGFSETPASPTLDPFQQPNLSVWQPVILKMSPDGSHVLFFTVIASGYGGVASLAFDHSGNLVISGSTYSSSFPLKNPIQSVFTSSNHTGFIAKLTPDSRTFLFSTYMGGSGGSDAAERIQMDTDDSFFVFGHTTSSDFPIKNAFQAQLEGYQDCTISKLTSSGALIFATFFGSPGYDACIGLLAQDGTLVMTGTTSSTEFPLVNPIQSNSNPGPFYTTFLAVMSHDGQKLLYSTYIGGDNFSGNAYSLAQDGDQNIYVFGRAFNSFFTLSNAFQAIWTGDFQGFLMKFDPTGRNIIFSTFTPGYGGMAVDSAQNIYLCGTAYSADFPQVDSLQTYVGGGALYDQDAYLMKLSASGKTILFSTLLGGSGADDGLTVVVDNSSGVYLTGTTTTSTDFPVKNAYQPTYGGGLRDTFLAKFTDTSSEVTTTFETSPALLTFQYVPGGQPPAMQTLAVTGQEQYFLTTNASWLSAVPTGSPTPPNSIQTTVNPTSLAPGTYTAVITLHPQSSSPASTVNVTLTVFAAPAVISSIEPALVPIGSDDTLITVNGSGFVAGALIYVSGIKWTDSPVTVFDAQTITFKMPKVNFSGLISYPITVLNPQSVQSNSVAISVGNPAPAFTAASVLNAASYAPAPVSVGEIVVVFGQNFGALGATSVLFDSNPAKVIYLTPTQLAATVPVTAGIGGVTTLQIQTSHDVFSAPVQLPIAPAAPGLFTGDASGSGQAAGVNQDNTVNGSANPAPAGSIVAFYGTGGGALTSDALPRVALPVSATIGGLNAQVLYAGVAPGEPDGVIQINAQVPAGLAPGASQVLVNIGGASSQHGVTLAVAGP
jgi:uncharacterized protein (TIGR03437 family)